MFKQLKALYHHLSMLSSIPGTLRKIILHEHIEYRIFRAMDRFRPANSSAPWSCLHQGNL